MHAKGNRQFLSYCVTTDLERWERKTKIVEKYLPLQYTSLNDITFAGKTRF
jgi:hypothetical protein